MLSFLTMLVPASHCHNQRALSCWGKKDAGQTLLRIATEVLPTTVAPEKRRPTCPENRRIGV